MKRFALAILFLALVSCSISEQHAQGEQTPKERSKYIVKLWKAWVKEHGIDHAAIAVSYKGTLIAKKGFDRLPTERVPIASVSKAVTGMCIAKLVAQGQLSFSDSIQDKVSGFPADMKIADLLTHTSGFREDITQRNPITFPSTRQELLDWVAKTEVAAVSRAPEKFLPGEYFYNNANYAMLGLVITSITGKSYEQSCGELVLEPAGILSYDLNPPWRIMSSWGGWRLSAVDVLQFYDHYFSNNRVMGKTPTAYPYHDIGNGLKYGMGYLFRTGRNGGYNFFHDGRWHVDFENRKHRFGAFAVKWDNGWAVSTNHSISALNGEHAELDNLLSTATHH